MGSMAMPTHERSKTLHNFSLPCLKWGNQRVLRCVKLNDPPPPPPPLPPRHRRPSTTASAVVVNGVIQSRPTIPHAVQHEPSSSNPDLVRTDGAAAAAGDSPRPWNLRTRRAACKSPAVRAEEKGIVIGSNFHESQAKRALEIMDFLPAKRQCLESPIKEIVNNKVCVSLSRDEIEEDFMEIARMRPPRRPKKRPRIVQKYLDLIFPGLWLTEVTADLYKVPEVPES